MMSVSISRYIFRSMGPALARSSPASYEISRGFAKAAAAKPMKAQAKSSNKTGSKKKGKKGDDDETYDVGSDDLDHRQFDKFLFSAQEAARYITYIFLYMKFFNVLFQ